MCKLFLLLKKSEYVYTIHAYVLIKHINVLHACRTSICNTLQEFSPKKQSHLLSGLRVSDAFCGGMDVKFCSFKCVEAEERQV